MQSHLNPDGFVQRHELRPVLGVPYAESTLSEKVRKGEFPQPIKLSTKCTVWRIGDVLEWLREQAAKGAPNDGAAGRKLTAARKAKRASVGVA